MRLTFYTSVFFTVLGLMSAALADDPDCSRETDATTLLNSGTDTCQRATPKAVKISIFQFAVCTSKPTLSETSSCDFVVDKDTSFEVEISDSGDPEDTKVSGLDPIDIKRPEIRKKYTHGLLLISNSVGVKTEFTFDNPQYDGMGRLGSKCWTNGKPRFLRYDYPISEMPMTCGDAVDDTYDFSMENLQVMVDDDSNLVTTLLNQTAGNSSTWDATLLSDKNPATEAIFYLDMSSRPISDAQYLWAVQKFNQPVVYGGEKLDIAFKIRESMHLQFSRSSDGNCTSGSNCVRSANLAGFEIAMEFLD